jgi:hypothetical protein
MMILFKNSIVLHVSTARQQLACVLHRLHGDSYWTVKWESQWPVKTKMFEVTGMASCCPTGLSCYWLMCLHRDSTWHPVTGHLNWPANWHRVNGPLVWFQQDGATSHTARISMQTVREMFPGRVISRNGDIAWPPSSPDLPPCGYSLWGYLKHKVYENRPHTIDELSESIRTTILQIPVEMLRKTTDSLRRRAAHLTDVFKK